MATKICKAIATDSNGATVFCPEAEHDIPSPIVIRPDESGVLHYWRLTSEDIEAERMAQEAAIEAYRATQA